MRRFLRLKKISPAGIHRHRVEVYGENVTLRKQVWFCARNLNWAEQICETSKVRAAKHAHHSPDFAPSDFQLFGPLKKHLTGHHFRTDAEVQKVIIKWLRHLDPHFFYVCFDRLVYRWHKCFNSHGDYVEK
ncbi:hypothetical protein AVEN_42535-1 [Araneus ventricosus]|uniref:Mariner Mos1 transposase n=1 Tax=Araneus ventricosus TaxID=182803 RepID=A0A4Y2JLK9_ARAVE|nr:hypothetical protein AVEN_42535-1 [Araneus ventricosus]